MLKTAVFDTKPDGRGNLAQAPGAERVAWRFYEFRLSSETTHQAFLTREVLGEIARVTTANVH